MKDEASRWFEEARKDLETADILYRNGRYNASCFYAHQSAEKAIKALLYKVNEAPWGHSIRVLLERYIEVTGFSEASSLLEYARKLDIPYIPSRYLGLWSDYDVLLIGEFEKLCLERLRKLLDLTGDFKLPIEPITSP